jgi:glycerophosphoryl diester phosphodiesterase
VPVITDISETFKITIAYGTGLWHNYRFQQDIFGFVLLPATLRYFTRGVVEALHQRNIKVLVCGEEVNNEQHIRECIEWGVDFIMTDRPDRLSKLLIRK